jgi:hypothetical protein
VLKIPRHDDWDVSEAYQRIDGVVPLESFCLVPLCRTVDHVIVGGKGYIYLYEEFLGRVFGGALGLNVISDVLDGGQNEIPCYQASQRSQPNTPFPAPPSRHKAGYRPETFEVRWLQSRGRRCNTETKHHFFRTARSALAFQAKWRPVPGWCTNESIGHDSLEMPVREKA